MDMDLSHYRGLVITTASRIVGQVEMEFDDIVQVLTIRVWRAVERHDPSRSSVTLDEFVFGCIQNQVIDIKRKARANTTGFEDLGFQSESKMEKELGLTVDRDVIYGEAEEEEVVLPNTLGPDERGLIELLTSGYTQAEAARFLGWAPGVTARTMRSIREKLADWAPSAVDPQVRAGSTPFDQQRAGGRTGRRSVAGAGESLAPGGADADGEAVDDAAAVGVL